MAMIVPGSNGTLATMRDPKTGRSVTGRVGGPTGHDGKVTIAETETGSVESVEVVNDPGEPTP